MPLFPDYVTINGLTFAIDGFCKARSLLPLLERGSLVNPNFPASGVDGVTFQPKNLGVHEVTLQLVVYSANASDGTAHTNRWKGLADNIDEIYDTCVEGSADAAVTATLTFQGGATKTGSVECPSMTLARIDGYRAETAEASLVVRMLDGKLA